MAFGIFGHGLDGGVLLLLELLIGFGLGAKGFGFGPRGSSLLVGRLEAAGHRGQNCSVLLMLESAGLKLDLQVFELCFC